jgi:DNA-binding transcriptional MerR regulator
LAALGATGDPEPSQLGLGRTLTRTELEAAVREEVEGGDALGHASRVVHLDREVDDAGAQSDLLGALAGGSKKHLGCRRVGVLLGEVMLDQPDAVEPEPVGELDLLEGAGTTVRNVRAYQDKGLLPPPRRDGRVGLYGEIHLSRLRLIARLLDRGYTLVNIAELLDAWERGHDLQTVLGLENVVSSPWSDEVPAYITFAELEELLPGVDPGFVENAAGLGLLEVEGDRLRVPSPRLLHAGAELVAAGVPIAAVLDHARVLRRDMERIARRFVRLAAIHALDRYLRCAEELSDDELSELGDLIGRLRPLAQMAVDAELARAMERQTLAFAGDKMAQLVNLRHLARRDAPAS